MKKNDIKHWYDGWIYTKFIAPNQRNLFSKIIDEIPYNSKIIDVACGTGEFSLLGANKMNRISGIDISSVNIANAQKRADASKFNNIDFLHIDGTNLTKYINEVYDYSVITFALHEMPHNIRLKVLSEMKEISKNIIIADYTVPQKNSSYSLGIWLIEFFAGIKHFSGFLSFKKKGGLKYYTKATNLNIYKKMYAHNNHSEIIFCR